MWLRKLIRTPYTIYLFLWSLMMGYCGSYLYFRRFQFLAVCRFSIRRLSLVWGKKRQF